MGTAMETLKVILIVVGMHLIALAAACAILIPAIRAQRRRDDKGQGEGDSGSDDGWGNQPRIEPKPSRWPGGGVPLPNAEQSRVRLRGPGRIANDLGHWQRRPEHAPAPHRHPVRN